MSKLTKIKLLIIMNICKKTHTTRVYVGSNEEHNSYTFITVVIITTCYKVLICSTELHKRLQRTLPLVTGCIEVITARVGGERGTLRSRGMILFDVFIGSVAKSLSLLIYVCIRRDLRLQCNGSRAARRLGALWLAR